MSSAERLQLIAPLLGWATASALACAALTAVAIRYASERGLLDRPGPRRSHADVTPRGGGIAIVGSVALATLALALREPLSARPLIVFGVGLVALAGLGFWDDHRPLPARWRLGTQFAIGAGVIFSLGGAGELAIVGWHISGWGLNLLALLALVWLINLTNFMDGINGIASAQVAFAAGVFALFSGFHGDPIGALLGAIVAGACVGFLPWNFPRARIFMGDSGSYGLGFALGFLFLRGHRQESFSVLMALACYGVFIVDATLTLLGRLTRRGQWYTPHRDHAYQRLVRGGWSHARVVAAVTLVNVLLVAPALWWATGAAGREPAACGAVLALLCALWWWVRRLRNDFIKES